MICLLCQSSFSSQQRFLDIFLVKQEKMSACSSCLSGFEKIAEQHCSTCYKSGFDSTCQDCFYWQDKGMAVTHQALYTYNQAMKDYFSSYKFQGDYLLRHLFANDVKSALRAYKDYSLVPIPLSSKSLKIRAFNQVQAFLDASNLTYQDILEKEDSDKQSSKGRQERLETEQVFSIKEGTVLSDKILLVDDIYTTGATIQLAKQLLHDNGVKTVKSFSLAR